MMNRRRFLGRGAAGSAFLLGGGGLVFVHRSHARAAVTSQMVDDALPTLAGNALRELQTLPVRAREEIKRYFLRNCLNVEGFVSHICSGGFVERLGRCRSQDEREGCFLQAFCARVTTEAEILNQVETIAAEVGNELDTAWSNYSAELSRQWNTRIQGYGVLLTPDELTTRLSGSIRADLSQAASQTASGNQTPAVGQTIGRIGASAILLLPLVRVGPAGWAVGIPLFLLLAARHVWDYVAARLEDRRGDYQAAISGRLALLGLRVGAEFEREVRLRLTDLHTWQERSVRETASRLAEERVGLI